MPCSRSSCSSLSSACSSPSASPALTVLGGSVALLVLGVIDAKQAFSGFSNSAPLTVAALYVLAAAAGRTRVLEGLIQRVSRPARGASPASGWRWRGSSGRRRPPPRSSTTRRSSRWRSPGSCPGPAASAARPRATSCRSASRRSRRDVTRIGTSTNLVVSGLLEESGHTPLGLFEIGKVGLPFAVAASC